MIDDGQHAVFVDAWYERAAKDLSSEVLLGLLEAAVGALWARTKITLGVVTLTAIAERVLYTASEKFPIFSSLEVDPTDGISLRKLRERASSMNQSKLREASRFVLVEFLTVIGNLTAEILTPQLHAELGRVAPSDAIRIERGRSNPTSTEKAAKARKRS